MKTNDVFSITLHNQGEFGTFYLREGKTHDYFWAELVIYSSFGCVGHYWSSMGMPALQFFEKIDRDYLMGKLFGSKSRVFDQDATIKEIKLKLFRQMRDGSFPYDELEPRDLYDELVAMPQCNTEQEFGEWFQNSLNVRTDVHELSEWLQPYDIPWQTRINGQAEGLWQILWPLFIEKLKEFQNQKASIPALAAELVKAYETRDNCKYQIDRLHKYSRMTPGMHADKQFHWDMMMKAEARIAEIKKALQ